jgi:hypothetical protein
MRSSDGSQKKSLRFSLLTVAILMGVAALSACGGGGGSNPPPPPPPPPPPVGTGITVFPGTTTVALGGKAVFTAYVPSAPTTTTFTWAVTGGSANGTITTDGTGKGDYVAPAAMPTGPVTVTVTSGSSLGGSATVTITAAAAGGVAVSPAAVAVPAGQPLAFSATVNGAAATVTQWKVNGTTGGDTLHGTIDSLGNYTAPAVPPPGGSTTITAVTASGSATSTATVVFSNSSFSGSYAFAYTGDDGSGFLAVAGSLTAQTGGTLTGEEDGSNGTQPFAPTQISGVFTIGPDGRGTVTIAGSAVQSAGETWQVALASNPTVNPGAPSQHAVLIRFDVNGSGSGTLDHQNTIATPFPVGSYAFGLSGFTSGGSQLVAAGRFSSTGNGGTVTNSSVWDVNFGGVPIPEDMTLQATFTPAPIGASVGRGTMTLFSTSATLNAQTGQTTTSSFSFITYLVDSTHVKVIENDGHAFLTGDVFSGPTTPLGSFTASNILKNGNYAFTVGGASPMGPYTAGGVFGYASSGGSGGTSTTGVMDINNAGVVIPLDKTLTTTVTFDANLGRISFILAPAGTSPGYTLAGYATSTGSVEMVETDALAAASGVAYPQVATAQPSGSFATNISGLVASSSGGLEQDISGQLSVASSTIAGTLDLNTFSDTSGGVPAPGLELLTGTAIVAPDSNGRGTMTLKPSTLTYQLVYYVVDSNDVLLMGTDGNHVVLGNMAVQF